MRIKPGYGDDIILQPKPQEFAIDHNSLIGGVDVRLLLLR
ncbi:hypothetical protein VAEU17_330167 [Vibrio aestuarianus]|nr:hypothetical protein VAEU17_330167 [Vibrio aestuarianus]